MRRWLRETGIPTRPMREVRRAQVAAMPYEERLRITAASRAKIKGHPRSEEWHRRRALGVQRAAKMSPYESVVFEFVRQTLGYEPVPQFAIGKFNIDIALPDSKFGIEVDGGLWHTRHSPRKMAQDRAKAEYLWPLGWRLVRVRARDHATLNRELRGLLEVLRPYARIFLADEYSRG